MTRTALALIALLPLSTLAQHTDKKVNVYGFIDFTAGKLFASESSPIWATGRDEAATLDLTHFSIYGDWKPHPMVRVLGEMSIGDYPDGTGQQAGTITEATIDVTGPVDTAYSSVDTLNQPVSPVENTYDHPQDGPLQFGSINLERIWVDLLFSEYLKLRVGKFVTPYGIWNVDHGSPAILTIRQPYQVGLYRMFPRSQIGLMGYGTTFLGNTDLTYRAYVSTGREQLHLEELTDLAVGANLEARLPVADGLELTGSGMTGIMREQALWLHVDLDTEVPLQIRLDSTFSYDTAASAAATDSLARAALEDSAMNFTRHTYEYAVDLQAREICLNVSAKLSFRNLGLQGEFTWRTLRNQLDGDKTSQSLAYYGLLSYRVPLGNRLSLTPYVMFEKLWTVDVDNNPEAYAHIMMFDGFTTAIGGLNLKFFSVASVKLEYGFIRISPQDETIDFGNLLDIHVLNAQLSVAF